MKPAAPVTKIGVIWARRVSRWDVWSSDRRRTDQKQPLQPRVRANAPTSPAAMNNVAIHHSAQRL